MKHFHVHAHVTPDVGETSCCGARSDKYRVTDPRGIAREQFPTLDSIQVSSEAAPSGQDAASACCAGNAPRGNPPSIRVTGKPAASCC